MYDVRPALFGFTYHLRYVYFPALTAVFSFGNQLRYVPCPAAVLFPSMCELRYVSFWPPSSIHILLGSLGRPFVASTYMHTIVRF